MGRKPREWKAPESAAGDVEPEYVQTSPPIDDHPVSFFGDIESPAPETPDVITTVKADEPIPSVEPDGEDLSVTFDENEPGRWVPISVAHEFLVDPAISIRAALAAAIANPGPWPNAERLGRAQRHMEELINALPEAIEAATGLLQEDLETLKDILA